MIHKPMEEPLQVYPDKDKALADLDRYAKLCKLYGVAPKYRVKAAPMEPTRYRGHWGVWLVKHG